MITDIFDSIINKTSSMDEATGSFKDLIEENHEIKDMYKDWCSEMGYKTKNGFKQYYSDYISSHDDDIQSMFETYEEFCDYLVYSLQ